MNGLNLRFFLIELKEPDLATSFMCHSKNFVFGVCGGGCWGLIFAAQEPINCCALSDAFRAYECGFCIMRI